MRVLKGKGRSTTFLTRVRLDLFPLHFTPTLNGDGNNNHDEEDFISYFRSWTRYWSVYRESCSERWQFGRTTREERKLVERRRRICEKSRWSCKSPFVVSLCLASSLHNFPTTTTDPFLRPLPPPPPSSLMCSRQYLSLAMRLHNLLSNQLLNKSNKNSQNIY
jgi:hypothetical protein